MTQPFVHPTAIVETTDLGEGTRVWAFAHVLAGAAIGNNCNLGDHVFVESGAVIGNNVTVKNGVCVWEGVRIEDDVFVGPCASFTNDLHPRSPRMPEVQARYAQKENWLVRTVVERGATIGANATIIGGIRIGRYSLLAAGAIVTRNVPPFALMVGAPAQKQGYVCRCGQRLGRAIPPKCCEHCGTTPEFFQQHLEQGEVA